MSKAIDNSSSTVKSVDNVALITSEEIVESLIGEDLTINSLISTTELCSAKIFVTGELADGLNQGSRVGFQLAPGPTAGPQLRWESDRDPSDGIANDIMNATLNDNGFFGFFPEQANTRPLWNYTYDTRILELVGAEELSLSVGESGTSYKAIQMLPSGITRLIGQVAFRPDGTNNRVVINDFDTTISNNLIYTGATPTDGYFLRTDGSGNASWQPVSGETNTASNQGAGSGVFKQKTGVDLEFKSIIGGTGINVAGNADDITLTTDDANINHNALSNYVANEHINHSSVSLTAGTGISATGLGDLTLSRTINLADTSVTPATYGTATQSPQITIDQQGRITSASNVSINHNTLTNYVANEHIDWTTSSANNLITTGKVTTGTFQITTAPEANAKLISDASGNASWSKLAYGALANENNSTGAALTVLNTYVEVPFETGQTAEKLNCTIDGANNRIQIDEAGIYTINFSGAYNNSPNQLEWRLFVNGVGDGNFHTGSTSFSTSGYTNIAFSGIKTLAANDLLTIRVRSNTASFPTTPILRDANFAVYKIN